MDLQLLPYIVVTNPNIKQVAGCLTLHTSQVLYIWRSHLVLKLPTAPPSLP